jgi:hypothetical protein
MVCTNTYLIVETVVQKLRTERFVLLGVVWMEPKVHVDERLEYFLSTRAERRKQ